MSESWRPVPGFPGYEISDQGRVRSYRARERGRGAAGWYIAAEPQRILRPGGGRYPSVNLMDAQGRRQNVKIHNLVMQVFVGPCPPGMEVCHNNGDPTDNRLANLRYDTHEANMADASRHNAWAERSGLDAARVAEIRRRRAAGESGRALAAEYGLSETTVYLLCSGRTWRHAGGPLSPGLRSDQKLSPRDVSTIRRLYATGNGTQRQIAGRFGISVSHVCRILSGKRRAQA